MQSRTLIRRRTAAIPALPRQKGRTPLRTLLAVLVTAPLDGIRYSALQAPATTLALALEPWPSTLGEANTASGVAALILNTAGTRNTANGAGAMVFNSTGNDNSGVGYFSLYNNDTGDSNSAVGSDTLLSNVSGDCNVAVGESALIMNTTG